MRRARGARALEEHPELDALVAPDTRVRCHAGRIPGFEVAHHLLLEVALEVPDVMRQRERVGNSPGVIDRIDRAAPAIANRLAAARPHGERDPEGAQTGGGDTRGSDTRVHPT